MKVIKLFASLLAILILFSGCAQSGKIGELAVVQGMGIDLVDEKTKITLQCLDFSKNQGGDAIKISDNTTAVSTGVGVNISDAATDASKYLSRKLFFSQNKTIVFGNEYAKADLKNAADYLIRSENSRPDVLLALSENTAEEIIKSNENGEKIPAESIYELLKTNEELGFCAVVNVNTFLNQFSDETSDVFLPVLSMKNGEVKCEKIAVFSDATLAVTLDGDETLGFQLIKGKVKNAVVTVNHKTLGKISLRFIKNNVKIKAFQENNSIFFNLNETSSFIVEEVENGAEIGITETQLKEIENLAKEEIKRVCFKAVKTCFDNKSDPFMTARLLSKSSPNQYKKLKTDWRERLGDVKINVFVNSKVQRPSSNTRGYS